MRIYIESRPARKQGKGAADSCKHYLLTYMPLPALHCSKHYYTAIMHHIPLSSKHDHVLVPLFIPWVALVQMTPQRTRCHQLQTPPLQRQ